MYRLEDWAWVGVTPNVLLQAVRWRSADTWRYRLVIPIHAAESGYSFRRVEGGNKYSDRYLNMFSVGGRRCSQNAFSSFGESRSIIFIQMGTNSPNKYPFEMATFTVFEQLGQ